MGEQPAVFIVPSPLSSGALWGNTPGAMQQSFFSLFFFTVSNQNTNNRKFLRNCISNCIIIIALFLAQSPKDTKVNLKQIKYADVFFGSFFSS